LKVSENIAISRLTSTIEVQKMYSHMKISPTTLYWVGS